MSENIILRVATKIMTPFILIFAFYVHFHGDYGPGGGFQAGVMLAGGIVLYGLVYGLDNCLRVVPPIIPNLMMALGVLIYAGTGAVSLFLDANFMNYDVLAHDAIHGQHRGILWVELGVITTVSGTMLSIFYAFAGRKAVD